MPRYAIDLVAQATRYEDHDGLDVLNHQKVQLYLESAIMQPSYKVGMFFDHQWWTDTSNSALQYPAPIASWEVTQNVLNQLAEEGFPEEYIVAMMKRRSRDHRNPLRFGRQFPPGRGSSHPGAADDQAGGTAARRRPRATPSGRA